jgi:hypothetical protein
MSTQTQAVYATITRKGRIGNKPREGTHFATEIVLEKLVRFDLAKAQGKSLITDHEIAKILGRSTRSLAYLRKHLSYLKKRVELTTGIGVSTAQTVDEAIRQQRMVLKMAMPTALRVLMNQLEQVPTTIAEKRLQTQVALEWLDREGTFPKISRTDIHQKVEHDYSSLDAASKDLLEALDSPTPARPADEIESILKVNDQFSNSTTITIKDQQDALTDLEKLPLKSDAVN